MLSLPVNTKTQHVPSLSGGHLRGSRRVAWTWARTHASAGGLPMIADSRREREGLGCTALAG